MRILKSLSLLLIITVNLFGQAIFSENDVEICNSKFELAVSQELKKMPINDVMVEIGKTSLGLGYEAATLEKGEKEQLVIHLSGLDCYTFLESSLVFARCIKKGKTTFLDYQNELKKTRYRNGIIDGYPSRLHYASDWLYDNNKRKIVKDITKELGGTLYSKKIDFMSTHSDSYKRLKNNPDFIKDIEVFEKEITNRDKYYIPENSIDSVESKIKNGDALLLTASAKGLDISHVGMAIKMETGRIHFMHAPLAGKKIQITEKPLGDYVRGLKRHTGIMVARLIDPSKCSTNCCD